MKTRIISSTNQKGGVGKTTTTISLAHVFAEKGRRVLILDLDPNGHASSLLIARGTEIKRTANDLLSGYEKPDLIHKTSHPFIELVPGNKDLCVFEARYSTEPEKAIHLQAILDRFLKDKNYDIVLIDTPSTVGALQYNAVTASDLVVIPAIPEYLSLNGFNNLLISLKAVRDKLRKNIKYYVLFTMCRPEVPSQKSILDWADAKIKNIHFNAHILYDTRFMEASASSSSIVDRFPDSEGAMSYSKLADEIESILPREAATV